MMSSYRPLLTRPHHERMLRSDVKYRFVIGMAALKAA